MMRTKLLAVLLASTLAGCATTPAASPDRGVASVNVPVLNRSNYTIDLAALGGVLSPGDVSRLDAWFQSLDLGYGDSIYVDGLSAPAAASQVAELAGRYGMMVLPAAPVTAGLVPSGNVRVVVSRNRAEVAGCPNWSVPSQPNFANRSMSNFGCGVNSNLAMQVANPEDLVHGREGSASVDAIAGAKAIAMYRGWPLTGVIDGQTRRPLTTVEQSTKGN
ncbi:CpaD family pilus assembly protein [Sphingomonas sabuli]|uniref:CpaD family pilus assembly protein n=1 Tax=Sphingomonas sabuli TaxID=2764186 RepID=A0A7G9L309_9SPHN|nr:CpaD family pilus assembly lipoprotein [Sphingomonas sabuli]QNM83008.1 CpaD family pilus assembly protein [Sphingomonas sabuli]